MPPLLHVHMRFLSLSISAWAGMYVTQVCFYTGVFLHQRTHLRTHSLQVVHICVYVYMCVKVHVYAHGFVCASMILCDTLRRWY